MRPSISLIIGITVGAMAIAVPAALGEGRVGGLEPQAVPSGTYRDAGERGALVQPGVTTTAPSAYRDAGERAVPPTTGSAGYVDANERGTVPVTPIVVATTDSGIDVAWSQVGIAFVVGVALCLGLLFALRSTRHGPLAH
jgi:hypothetical protein